VETLVKIANFFDLSLDYLLLDSTHNSSDDKLLIEIENIFRDKNPSQTAFLLNLLKVQAEKNEYSHSGYVGRYIILKAQTAD